MRRRRIGHGPVRYVGWIGFGYSLFSIFLAFCVMAVVVGLVYLYWPIIAAVFLFAVLLLASRHK